MRVERAGAADKAGDVEALAKYFDENKRSEFSAATLAETAQYLMDKDRLDYVNRLLLAAVDRDGRYPESYAALARLNRRTGFPEEELKALELSVRFFGEADQEGPLTQRRVRAYLGSLIRLGEVRIASAESLSAEEVLASAIARYERAVTERILRREPGFGKAYSLMADLHFLGRRDFQSAEALYAKAEDDGFVTPDTDYRRGYIQYYGQTPNPERALGYFHRASLDREPSPYLLWASANALFERGDFFAAQGYFSMLVERLQFELSTITLIEPQYRPSHEEIVELLAMAQNNLGVSLYRVADRMGDASRRAGAMVAFTESARLYDSLSRDQFSMLRSESKNLGFLNLDFVLHPLRGIDIAIYRQLPLDMSYPRK
jgi:tetratricopeptide (TPR) repeat protein